MKKLLAAIITVGALAAAALVVGSPAGAQTNTEVNNTVYTVDSGFFEFVQYRLSPPGVNTINDQIVGGEIYADGTGFIELATAGTIEVNSLSVTRHFASITFTYGGWTFSGALLEGPPGQYHGSFQGSHPWPPVLSKISQLGLTPVR